MSESDFMYSMDDETLRALHVIIDDHTRDDPAGTRGDIEDLERLNRAYEIVVAWYLETAREPTS